VIEYRLILPMFIDPKLAISERLRIVDSGPGGDHPVMAAREALAEAEAKEEIRRFYDGLAEHCWKLGECWRDLASGAVPGPADRRQYSSVTFLSGYLGRVHDFISGYAFEILADRLFPAKHSQWLHCYGENGGFAPGCSSWHSIDCGFVRDQIKAAPASGEWCKTGILLSMSLERLRQLGVAGTSGSCAPSLLHKCVCEMTWGEAEEAADGAVANVMDDRTGLEEQLPLVLWMSPWARLVPGARWEKVLEDLRNQWQATCFVSCEPLQGNYWKRTQVEEDDQSDLRWDMNLEVVCYIPVSGATANAAIEQFDEYILDDVRFAFLQDCIFYTKAGFPFMLP